MVWLEYLIIERDYVGYVPFANGHYVENTGTETLWFLEMFKSDRF